MTNVNQNSNSRVNPFELSDFEPKSNEDLVGNVVINKDIADKISKDNGFPSREPVKNTEKKQRRYRTGRNVQFNIKATAETVDLFYQIADKENITLGELLGKAIKAYHALANNSAPGSK